MKRWGMMRLFELDVLIMEAHVALKKIQYKMEEMERKDELYGDVANILKGRLQELSSLLDCLEEASEELSYRELNVTESFLDGVNVEDEQHD
jgi:hypothetical protein